MPQYASSPPSLVDEPSSFGPRAVVGHDEMMSAKPGVRKGSSASRMRVQYARRFSAALSALGWSQSNAAKQLLRSRRWVLDFSKGRAPLTEESQYLTELLESLVEQRRTGT